MSSSKKLTRKGTLWQVWGPEPIPPLLYTEYVYTEYLFTQGRGGEGGELNQREG